MSELEAAKAQAASVRLQSEADDGCLASHPISPTPTFREADKLPRQSGWESDSQAPELPSTEQAPKEEGKQLQVVMYYSSM